MKELSSIGVRPESKNRLEIIKNKLYLPEIFDKRLEAVGAFQPDILACTTMPLPRLCEDLSGMNLGDEHWVQALPTKTVTEGKLFFKKQKTKYVVDPLELIRGNRYYYGWQSGIIDVLKSDYPMASKKILAEDYSPILYLGEHYPKFAPILKKENLYNLIEKANTFPRYKASPAKIEQATELLVGALGDIPAADTFLAKASKRQGVQVVYGGEGFDKYLKTRGKETGDIWAASRFSERIPLDFITAVLPVGPYEQEKLLGTTY